jgi:hypothetical protein
MELDPDGAYRLISDIAVRSSGVFVWVYITVDSILSDMCDTNSSIKLLHRLEYFPTDLELLYTKLLEKDSPRLQGLILTTLRLFIASQVQIISSTSQSSVFEPILTNVGLFLADKAITDRELVFQESVEPWNQECIIRMEDISRALVASRTGGLLSLEPQKTPKSGSKRSSGQLISYIHQTARIFIEEFVQNPK